MGALVLVALLFGGGGIWNIVAAEGDGSEALACFGSAALALLLLWHFRREAAHDACLADWLVQNEPEIRRGGVDLHGRRVTPETQLACFDTTLSFLILTVTLPGRLHLEGASSRLGPAVLATGLTLVLGWWGIPFGPLLTLATLGRNVAGGRRLTVGDLLDGTGLAEAEPAAASAHR